MRRAVWLAGLALAVGACAPTSQERVREYAEDGVQLYNRGKYADARDSFQVAVSLSPNDADLQFNLAHCHDKLGKADLAEKGYESCLKGAPDHAECRHALTVLLVGRGRRQDAEKMIQEWYQRAPQSAGPRAEQGWLLAQDNDVENARAHFQTALAIDPRNVRALTELARLYESLNRPDRALWLYEHALAINPNQPEVTRKVGELRAKGVGRPRPD
jgi:Flp pilus assembly protein TadD